MKAIFWSVIVVFTICQMPAYAKTELQVEFDIPVASPTALEKRKGIDRTLVSRPEKFGGFLRIPDGANNAPAIVVNHTCHGRSYYQHWLDRFYDWGFVTLAYSRCNTKTGMPDDTLNSTFDWKRGAPVAFGALHYLASRPEVDSSRIAIIGWSRPAMSALSVLNYEGFSQFFDLQFKTAIAVYPFCSFARGPHRGPILIVSAGKDDYVDPHVCKRISESTASDRFPIKFRVFDEAYHGFDIPQFGQKHWAERAEINPDEYSANGGTLEYHSELEANLIEMVNTHLKSSFGF